MKKYRRYLIWYLFFCWTLGMFLVSVHPVDAAGNNWYVNPSTGSDSNAGTIGSPVKTIRKAINLSGDSDTIYLRGGTYTSLAGATGILVNRSGTADAWYTIRNYPGESPVINGSVQKINDDYGVFNFGLQTTAYRESYIRVTGLRFENVTGSGVTSEPCAAIRITKEGSGGTGTSSHYRIDNCSFYNMMYSAIFCFEERAAVVISYVEIADCSFDRLCTLSGFMGEGVSLKGLNDGSFHDNTMNDCTKCNLILQECDDIDVYNNEFYELTDYARHGVYCCGSSSVTSTDLNIYNNYFEGSYKGAIDFGVESGNTGTFTSCEVYNNIVVMDDDETAPDCYGMYFDGAGTMTITYTYVYENTFSCVDEGFIIYFDSVYKADVDDLFFASNIFQYTAEADYAFKATGLNKTGDGLALYTNCFYDTSATAVNDWYGTETGVGATDIVDDPKFQDRAGLDFHLNSSSPCKDAGSITYKSGFDYDGIVRPQGAAYDIGAFEYWEYTPPEIPDVDPFIPPLPPSSYEHYGWVELLTQLFADLSAPLSLIAIFAFLVIFIYLKVS